MSCSIISDDIRVLLTETGKNTSVKGNSGFQNPDISRLALDSMLRHTKKDSTRHYWTAFMDGYKAQPANAND